MMGIKYEVCAAILQENPGALGDDATAEAHIQAVDERTGVTFTIYNAQINGV